MPDDPLGPFDDALRELEEREHGDYLTIPVWSALLSAVAATIAELDSVRPEDRTTANALARIHWFLENPSRDMPVLVLSEEELLQAILDMFRESVDWYQDQMSNP